MGLILDYSDGQTPLDEDEKDGLLIPTIMTRRDLDEFEQLGVEKTNEWLLRRKLNIDKILTEDFLRDLHKRMFVEIWQWAGSFKKTEKNIGVDPVTIQIEIRKLLDDCKYWIENEVFDPDEVAVRFSHRLVWIHPFANGNGRHSRLIADVLINKDFNKTYFTWGSVNLTKEGEARDRYLSALRSADQQDYKPLIVFARL